MRRPVFFDAILKDLFGHHRPTLLDELTGGIAVREVLNVEFAMVEERRADLVLLLADDSILHIEFQSANDPHMPQRMAIYAMLIDMKYGRPLRQVVIYVGEARMTMANRLAVGKNTVEYDLMDIRELDARELLRSGRPEDCVLALLAGGGTEILHEIVARANELQGAERDRVMTRLVALSGLRQLSNQLKIEYEAMPVLIEIEKNVFLKEAWDRAEARGRAEGEARGRADSLVMLLQLKFQRVPKWARERIASASPERLNEWLGKILTARTIEGVLGKR